MESHSKKSQCDNHNQLKYFIFPEAYLYIPNSDPILNLLQILNYFTLLSLTHRSSGCFSFLHSKISFINTNKNPSFSTSAKSPNRLQGYPPTSDFVGIHITLSLRPLSNSLILLTQIPHYKERPRSRHRKQHLLLHKSHREGGNCKYL